MIRPVDMQMLIPKSTEVNRVNHDEARRPDISNQHFSQELTKQVTHNQQQVVSSNKSENSEIDKDSSNKNRKEQQRRKGKQQEAVPADHRTKAKSTSMFDYSI